ncbi:DUF6445 family protein [Colwellia sp. 1_MG-2023]|uniref:DUF6445 family protein n=1 Tax=unclassified Colwellia TaxID=196834 RepID=UPI001C096D41|nr:MULTISPECIES: DUF6445 family protein [unclassified Colwellia]MBU2924282.1 hypothetical protein [Colwellia sp. C2M11]MDO6652991.1 DUF6445 family protein [Colwellia sp. 3_MG-2023]MDO6665473.1 DUF6445 family protein [Colwellia sp. 2_MG-2023]MDO6689768.1 DUF6445 family protein [Colwellia sp. 1_MG-2023]
MYSLNPHLTQQVCFIGNEKTPILVVDNFMLDYSAAINEATKCSYTSDKRSVGEYYPGVRAPVGSDYGMALLQHTAVTFYKIFGVPKSLTLFPQNGSYSLITKQIQELDLLQCIPHFDNTKIFSFAMLHYLNQGDFGGTGFYCQKPTGFENITAVRKSAYLESAQQHINKKGNPVQQYFTHSTDHFELIHKVDYKTNRLVIYPGTILHSAFIDKPQRDVCAAPKVGRLSANFFIEFK